MIRILLDPVYEPIFEQKHQNANYGFRTGKSTHMAIEKLKRTGQGLKVAIEGEISKAYDTVDHDRLIEILNEKIKDKKFLNLIYTGLKSGVFEHGKYQHTLLGIPQGGVVNRLLFNINMSKFNEFVQNVLSKDLEVRNINENRKVLPITKQYKKHESTPISQAKNLKRQKKRLNFLDFKHWPDTEKEMYKNFKNRLRESRSIKKKIRRLDPRQKILKLVYTRYTDDWVIISNISHEDAIKMKQKIADFLKQNLKLSLSEEKTHVTNLEKHNFNFLGFKLGYYKRTRKFTTIRPGLKTIKDPLNKKKILFVSQALQCCAFLQKSTGLHGFQPCRLVFVFLDPVSALAEETRTNTEKVQVCKAYKLFYSLYALSARSKDLADLCFCKQKHWQTK
jgi:hypothetical protein